MITDGRLIQERNEIVEHLERYLKDKDHDSSIGALIIMLGLLSYKSAGDEYRYDPVRHFNIVQGISDDLIKSARSLSMETIKGGRDGYY